MSSIEYEIPNKKEYIDFAESIYLILNQQKTLILSFDNKDIEILKNYYVYGYVWGFVAKLITVQEKKNNYEFESVQKVLIIHYCFSKFFEIEMNYKTIVPILDVLIDKKSKEGEAGTKDGFKEAGEWSESNIPCLGLVVKNIGMEKEEYDSLRKKNFEDIKEPINFSSFFDWDGAILALVECNDSNFRIAVWKPNLKKWVIAEAVTLQDINKPQYGGITYEQKKEIKKLMTQEWIDNGKL